jgi:hypothetical protein
MDVTEFRFLNASGEDITNSDTFVILAKAADIPRRDRDFSVASHGYNINNIP